MVWIIPSMTGRTAGRVLLHSHSPSLRLRQILSIICRKNKPDSTQLRERNKRTLRKNRKQYMQDVRLHPALYPGVLFPPAGTADG